MSENIEPRYYYDDPLEAAWMAHHFHLRFITDGDNLSIPKSYIVEEAGDLSAYDAKQKSYVDPRDNYMFVPTYEDVCGDGYTFGLYFSENTVAVPMRQNGKDYYCLGRIQIIQRAGKAFFTPKMENTDDRAQAKGE